MKRFNLEISLGSHVSRSQNTTQKRLMWYWGPCLNTELDPLEIQDVSERYWYGWSEIHLPNFSLLQTICPWVTHFVYVCLSFAIYEINKLGNF